jgi:hypothetical protein
MAIDYETLTGTVTASTVKQRVIDTLILTGMAVTAWLVGDPSQQWLEAFSITIAAFTQVNTAAIRARFLDLATDPGDDGITPIGPGWLSAIGESDYYTFRAQATLATTGLTIYNGTGAEWTFSVGGLAAQNANSGASYKNTLSSAYNQITQTYTMYAGETIVLPFAAEAPGTASNAAPGEISILVNRPVGVTVTNPSSATGAEREPPQVYRDRCRSQAAATSPNGPSDAYRRMAATNADGTPLLRAVAFGGDGVTPVGITRVQRSKNSVTGDVSARYADEDGGSDPVDVDTAVDNTQRFAVPDGVTFDGAAADDVAVPVTYTVKALATEGLTSDDIKDLVLAKLEALFRAAEIGGYDQVAGAGTLYADSIKGAISSAHPSIYHTTLTLPSSDIALAFGEVAILSDPVTGTVTLV